MQNTTSDDMRPVLAVGAVIFRDDHILLIRRARAPFRGQWSIPGGKVKHGETLLDALHREITEEAGIAIEVCSLIDAFEALPQTGLERHYVMIDYVARWVAGTPRPGDDALAAQFFPINEARKLLAWDRTRTALDMALKQRPDSQ